nr:unnamed protein product [Callosobruchus chinensis]CAH7749768.1 unnamed protein product [Callosobruchus chinensis]
MQSREGQFDS